MTREEIIGGLQFTIDMFLFDPSTGETREEYRLNDMDKTTIDACKGAIELLKRGGKMNIAQLLLEPLTKFDLIYFADILTDTYKEKGYKFTFENFNGSFYYMLTVVHTFPAGKIEETLIEPLKNKTLMSAIDAQITLVNNAERHYNNK